MKQQVHQTLAKEGRDPCPSSLPDGEFAVEFDAVGGEYRHVSGLYTFPAMGVGPSHSPKPAGWYRDPSGRYDWRYFEGEWTDDVANEGDDATYTDPVPGPRQSLTASVKAEPGSTTALKRFVLWRGWRRKLGRLPVWAWTALLVAVVAVVAS